MKKPLQPIYIDEYGTTRFEENEIVRRLLDEGPFDMNDIAMWDVSREDAEQFAQLIGYSVSGFGDLSYTDRVTVETADEIVNNLVEEGSLLDEKDLRIEVLEDKLETLKSYIREAASYLFGIHPDDLE